MEEIEQGIDALTLASTSASGSQENYEYTWLGNEPQEQKSEWGRPSQSQKVVEERDYCQFYDPKEYPTVLDWVKRDHPFGAFGRWSKRKSIICLHPKFDDDVQAFKRNNRRYKLIPPEFKEAIAKNKELVNVPENRHLELKHPELLDMAEKCNVLDGFWYISCSTYDTKPLVLVTYFIEVSEKLRAIAKKDSSFNFVKIEATVEHYEGYGILSVSVEDFTNLKLVSRIGMFIKALIKGSDIDKSIVQNLCFKPHFYYASDLDRHFSDSLFKNIYRYDLTQQFTKKFRFESGVEEWLDQYSLRKESVQNKQREDAKKALQTET